MPSVSKAQLKLDNESLYEDNKKLLGKITTLSNEISRLEGELLQAQAKHRQLESKLRTKDGKDISQIFEEMEEAYRLAKIKIKEQDAKLDTLSQENSKLKIESCSP